MSSNQSEASKEIQSVHSQAPENVYEDTRITEKGANGEPIVAPPVQPKSEYLFVGMLCLLIAFGGFVFGWDTGTISGFVNMSDFKRRFGQVSGEGEYYLSNVRVGLIVSIFNIGCAIGGIVLSKMGDVYGRKKGLTFSMIIYVVGIVIQIASVSSWVQYFIGRIISGLAVGCVAVISPMFLSETSPKQIRGILVSCYQLMITAGIFLGYCTTYGTKSYTNSVQWRVPLGLSFFWAILLVLGMSLLPESPRYLVENNLLEEARLSIARVNKVDPNHPFVNDEVDLIFTSIEKEKLAGNATWGELITGKPKIFYRVFVGVMLQSLQQLTGNNYFFYYGTTIFSSVGLKDSFETSIILGIVNFASTFVAFVVIERLGRRKTLLAGSAAMAVCLVIFASVGVKSLYPNGYDQETSKPAGNAMIVFTCIYLFCFATTWAPGVYVVVSETYPLRIRSKGMAVATGANWLWGFLIAFFTPFITKAIHFAYGFVFFGCVLFSFFFVFACVPETKGLTLEEVDDMYAAYTPGLAFMNKFHKDVAVNKDVDTEAQSAEASA